MQVEHRCRCSNEAVELRTDSYFGFLSAGKRMAQLTKYSAWVW